MVTAVLNFSRGPLLAAGDKGVHIIFIPAGIGSGDPGADGLPTAPQLAEAASCIGTPKKTDVIVFAGRPWHLAGGLLLPHPQVHALVPGDRARPVHRSWRESGLVERGRVQHHGNRGRGSQPRPRGSAGARSTAGTASVRHSGDAARDRRRGTRADDSRRALDGTGRGRTRPRVQNHVCQKRSANRPEHALQLTGAPPGSNPYAGRRFSRSLVGTAKAVPYVRFSIWV